MACEKEYRLRRRDGAAWREIGDGRRKTRNIKRLARAALEREGQVGAYRVEAVDGGRFPGVHAGKQPWRRERGSGGEGSPENPAIPWGTGPVLSEIFRFCRETLRAFSAYNLITGDYKPITAARTGPWSATARAAKWTQGIRGYVAAGHHEHTGIGDRGRRPGCTEVVPENRTGC